MGVVVGAGQRFAAIADMQVGDGNQGKLQLELQLRYWNVDHVLCLLFTKDVTQQ